MGSGLLFVIIFALFAAACPTGDGTENNTSQPGQPEQPEQPGGAGSEPVTGNTDTENANAVITLKGTTAEFTGANVNIATNNVYGTIVEITGNGTYVIQGTLNQGFVAVSKKDLDVTIVLNGVNIFCKNYAALTCLKKSNVTLVLAKDSVNYLTDGGEGMVNNKYPLGYDDEEQPNAALLIRRNLTIKGSGKLYVNGNGNNGIGSRANLKIEDGDITVTALKNALKGNDSIAVSGGRFNLVSGNDAIITEEIDDGMGAINITGGEFVITAVNDAVQASTSLTVSNAAFTIKTGGGSNVAAITGSAKGLKAGSAALTIHSGTFNIDSNDDSVHSDGTITINGGTFTISSGDNAIRADERLTINSGTINISKCYEGLESLNIDLNGGFVKIKASDDGINIAGGKDSSAANPNPGGGWKPGRPGGSQVIDGMLTITGGEYRIESSGDGLDSNGNIRMEGGAVVIFGPASTSTPEVPIDYNGAFVMTGGLIVALGNNGSMLQQPGSSSTQNSFLFKSSSTPVSAGSLINVSSSSGTEVVTVRTIGATRSLVVCSPLLARGTSYVISSGGSYSGSENELGLFEGGTYSGGSVLRTFTISNTTTTVN